MRAGIVGMRGLKAIFSNASVALWLALAGACSNSEAPEEILTVKESTLAAARAEIQHSLEQKLYTNAVKTTASLARLQGLSPEQLVLLKNAVLNVKVQLAEAAEAGDTNAAEAIQFFERSSVLGR